MYDRAIEEMGSDFNLELEKALLMIEFPDHENPMKGVLALVDLSEEYPEEPRIFRELGQFSIQTGQWDRAQERLEKAYALDQDHKRTICLRSEEHTSELQSRGHLVCRLLLEKKKKVMEQNAR